MRLFWKLGVFQRPLTLILPQKYRDTNGSRIVIQIGGVYTTVCQEEGILLQKYAIDMGDVSRYFSKVSGSGVVVTLLRNCPAEHQFPFRAASFLPQSLPALASLHCADYCPTSLIWEELLGNENSAQSFSDRSFCKSLGVVDVRAFGSWMSAPKCLFFQHFECPDRSFGPGCPREWPPGRPRDIHPKNFLFGLIFPSRVVWSKFYLLNRLPCACLIWNFGEALRLPIASFSR